MRVQHTTNEISGRPPKSKHYRRPSATYRRGMARKRARWAAAGRCTSCGHARDDQSFKQCSGCRAWGAQKFQLHVSRRRQAAA